MEAGYVEKVDELCKRYSLEGFKNVKSKLVLHLPLFINSAFFLKTSDGI